MNCDQVFDVLTRGPFPTGTLDVDVPCEMHLEDCESCRRLAEALQPAVELLSEAVDVEDRGQLPGYWGDHFDGASSATVMKVAKTERAAETGRRSASEVSPVRQRWLSAMAVAAVLLLALFVRNSMHLDESSGSQQPQISEVAAGRSSGDLLSTLRTVSGCLEEGAAMPLAMHHASAQQKQCCTDCHSNSQAGRIPLGALARLTQSCTFCHMN